ncbi:MAG: hypothetical protein ACKO3N_18215 [Verrucomicrobiota bacterium]
MSTFVRAAKLKATAGGTSLRAVLECILLGQFNSSVVNGRTVISTSEAGGSVQFEILDGLGPARVAELAGEALDWLDSLPAEQQANPIPPRRIRRLRVSFSRAQV